MDSNEGLFLHTFYILIDAKYMENRDNCNWQLYWRRGCQKEGLEGVWQGSCKENGARGRGFAGVWQKKACQ